MKFHIIAGHIILALSLTAGHALSAQDYSNTPVSISKEKVKVNGTVCYSHVVLERQTLFSISKAYNVSIEDLYKYNPSVKEKGLIKNSIIIIPVVEAPVQEVKTEEIKAEEIKIEEVRNAADPQVQEPSSEPKKKKKKTHVVKWYENIDDISSKYGVTPEEIMMANNLEERKLKSRMKLVIPEPGEYMDVIANAQDVEVSSQDSTSMATEIHPENEEHAISVDENQHMKVTASVLLPLNANGLSGSRSNMDFYSGVLLAINDLAQSGISTDLNVHDINGQDLRTLSEQIVGSNLAIGPVSSKNLTDVLSSGADIPMVISPLDPRAEKLIADNPKMIQAPTPYRTQYDDLVSWIKEEMTPSDKVLLITEKGARLTETAKLIKTAVDSSGIVYSPFSYSILEGRDVITPLGGLMTQEGTNRVLIASESEAFVNDVVRNLNVMIHSKYPVILYGTSKFRSFETIEVENFHNTNMHVSLTYYIDYDNPKVKNFLLKYRALFNTEPTQFAFQGYDIATYFVEMCSKYGNSWPEKMASDEKDMLQSTFKCTKDGDGGYVNQGVRRIVYGKDWSISRVR